MEQAIVSATVQYRETMAKLSLLERSQFPYAYAKTLTNVAQLGQLAVRIRMRWSYNLHGDWLPKGILVQRAEKTDIIQYGLAQSVVYSSKASTPYIGLHETGGTKRPKAQRRVINMPSITLQRKQYRTRTGATAKPWKPSSLLKNYNAQKHAIGRRKKGAETKPYLIAAKGGQPALVAKRRGSTAVGVEVLWMFIKTARIKPTLKAAETVKKQVEQNMERLMNVNLNAAMTSSL